MDVPSLYGCFIGENDTVVALKQSIELYLRPTEFQIWAQKSEFQVVWVCTIPTCFPSLDLGRENENGGSHPGYLKGNKSLVEVPLIETGLKFMIRYGMESRELYARWLRKRNREVDVGKNNPTYIWKENEILMQDMVEGNLKNEKNEWDFLCISGIL